MYCYILDFLGSIYKIIESFGQGQRGIFEVVFEEAECEINCIYIQSSSLGGFFASMPLQCWYITQSNYF